MDFHYRRHNIIILTTILCAHFHIYLLTRVALTISCNIYLLIKLNCYQLPTPKLANLICKPQAAAWHMPSPVLNTEHTEMKDIMPLMLLWVTSSYLRIASLGFCLFVSYLCIFFLVLPSFIWRWCQMMWFCVGGRGANLSKDILLNPYTFICIETKRC